MSELVPDIAPRPSPDYPALREEFLDLIGKLSGAVWTDHNTHDPGVTLGEHLAFGLTEAAYVAGLPVPDLLAPRPGETAPPSPNFPAELVLPCRPVTLLDLRRLVLDRPGVRNAWLEEVVGPPVHVFMDCALGGLTTDASRPGTRPVPLRGFYRVPVEFTEPAEPAVRAAQLAAVRAVLEAHRNLAEVFLEVVEIRFEDVGVCLELDADEAADLGELAAQVWFALGRHLAPTVKFHALADRLAAGLPTDEIFNGPLLEHGFLDDAELARAERPTEVRASDLVQVLHDVPGVRAVRRLTMSSWRDGLPIVAGEKWLLPLDPARAARLDVAASRLFFFKRGLPFLVRPAQVAARLAELRAAAEAARYPAGGRGALAVATGRPREITSFPTLLNLFPLNYGVGPDGLPGDAPPARQAQAAQWKAFVVLLEQFLAGQRAQTARLPELLGLHRHPPVVRAGVPADVRGLDGLAVGGEAALAAAWQPVVEPEAERLRRRLAVAAHLLARFSESLTPLILLSPALARRPDPAVLLPDALRLLAAAPRLAHDLPAAENLLLDPAAPDNVSGLVRRLRVLLGDGRDLGAAAEFYDEADTDGITEWRFRIRDAGGNILLSSSRHYHVRAEGEAELAAVARHGGDPARYERRVAEDGRHYFNLTDETGEVIARRIEFFATEAARDAALAATAAFFQALPGGVRVRLLEHLLLRPRPGGTELLPACDPDGPGGSCPCDDPYSFRLTVLLPSRRARFRGLRVRGEAERLVRESAPAHLFVKICWLGDHALDAFDAAWLPWRRELARELAGEPAAVAPAQDALIRVWRGLRSEFPVATLHDCVDGDDENPAVLGQTVLGTLPQEDSA
jgi:hypothetical protein